MDRTQHDNFLKDEYLLLQNQYEDYDKRSLTIKGWISSGAVVALALGFNESYGMNYAIPVIVAIVVASVWYLDAYWKLFQYALRPRIKAIEAYFREGHQETSPDFPPLQVYGWWFKGYRQEMSVLRAGFQLFVMLPYAPILVICVVSFIVLVR